MNPFKLLKKLVKLLRGGAGTWEIFTGCLLGMIIGMTPGFNMTIVIAVVLLLVLNAHMALALTALAIGKILCLILAPVTFEIGYVLVHGIGLEGLFHTFSQTPVLALMNLHYYCLVGGLPIKGFTRHKGEIMKADVAAQGFKGFYFRQLFFNRYFKYDVI